MAVAPSTRPRPALTSVPTGGYARKPRRSRSRYVLIAIPVVLAATFFWQIGSSMFHPDSNARQAVSVGPVTLEADPGGTRVDFVVVDRAGQETTFNGTLDLRLREPDGRVWQTSRTLAAADFQPLPDTSLLAGRLGYSVFVPANDWARAPRRGGLASVSIAVTPGEDGGAPFSSDIQQRFP